MFKSFQHENIGSIKQENEVPKEELKPNSEEGKIRQDAQSERLNAQDDSFIASSEADEQSLGAVSPNSHHNDSNPLSQLSPTDSVSSCCFLFFM